MKRKVLVISILILLIIGIYLNRSYAHIYDKIGTMDSQSFNLKQTYAIGSSSKESLTYVAFGDSLTAGVGALTYEQSYPYQFAQKLFKKNKQPIKLIPFAIPGAKTNDAIHLLLDPTIKTNPDIITILLGVNDIHGNISKKDFIQNYEIILKKLKQETQAKIYIINIPYIGAPSLLMPPYDYYFDSQTQEFNETLKQMADENQVVYIDLYTPTRESAKQKEYYSPDLFHPSTLGYTLWAEILYDTFNQ
jgi:acyl-CoA thioesterase-1